jgi:hypothetical protein
MQSNRLSKVFKIYLFKETFGQIRQELVTNGQISWQLNDDDYDEKWSEFILPMFFGDNHDTETLSIIMKRKLFLITFFLQG